ncbi:MAG: hypothetical protein Q9168_006334, partial [Polycauliona sp. 1 TL-2023]
MASLAKQPHQRQSTKSNSSSVVTVQRAASTRNTSRPSPSGLRPQSPNETGFSPGNLSVQNFDTRRRSSATYAHLDSSHGVREGVGNLNRWSQSTVSSGKSSTTHARRSSFSKRISGSFGTFAGFHSPQSLSPNGKVVGKSRPSATTSPEEAPKESSQGQPTHQPAPTLPPIVTLSSLSQAVDAADSPSTVAELTPATADLLSPLTYHPEPDYFGNRWKARSPSSQKRQDSQNQRKSPYRSPGPVTSPPSNISPPTIESKTTANQTEGAVSKFSKRASVQVKDPNRETHTSRTGDRGGTISGGGQAESEESASASASTSEKHEKIRKEPSQKAMLSKALQKANHAVLLDNAQNFEGAMKAYGDACALLQKVMLRSSGDEDRRKLEAVRTTYSNRINELRNTDLSYQNADGKALPRPPGGRDSSEQEPISPLTDEEDEMITIGHATAAQVGGPSLNTRPHLDTTKTPTEIPPRRHSLRPPASRLEDQPLQSRNNQRNELQQQEDQQPWAAVQYHRPTMTRATTLDAPRTNKDMPPPLSPRRLPSSNHRQEGSGPDPPVASKPTQPRHEHAERKHSRQETTESTSWLDTIDESGGSSASSVHSRTSSIGVRRKRIRAASGATEAEFDAALDAAVEAAYDDGFEPANDDYYDPEDIPDAPPYTPDEPPTSVSDARHNVELAKERVREVEREAAIAKAKNREKTRLQENKDVRDSIGSGLSDEEADDEERMLEEMTRGYILDSDYNVQSKSALPRQSDSSGFSGRTWGSSIGSNPTSAGTSMSMAAGAPALPSLPPELQAKQMPPPAYPPPSGALPNLPHPIRSGSPVKASAGQPPGSRSNNAGVRERRLSGIKAPQLKIETGARMLAAPIAPAPLTQPPPLAVPLSTSTMTEAPKSAFAVSEPQRGLPTESAQSSAITSTTQASTRKGSSPYPGDTTPNTFPQMPALHKVTTGDSEDSVPSVPDSPAPLTSKGSAGPGTLRKNFSSSSLKKMLTVSNSDVTEAGPSTAKLRRAQTAAIPSMPTPKGANFMIDSIPSGGIHLFESDIHSPASPGTPNPMAANAPLPLEPCPGSTLLRPFWFLRCIFQSVTHPRGGYISTRLFVPRDIWKVTNVKLKSVDEKVSSCDLLTATLLKLAKVDTFDANAVLEEMQFLETIMEQSQVVLSKKLGSEVGVGNIAWLAKGSGTSGDTMGNGDVFGGKTINNSTKSYLSSWRKKMSKTSSTAPGFTGATASNNNSRDGNKEVPLMSSVPMTATQKPRFAHRDVSQIQYIGPHAHYMGALARLCDAAQILDQIARGVEDPGLKHSSPTHVGLELSARHAAEFFAFYICRFVFNDISMMLDKFIKRG